MTKRFPMLLLLVVFMTSILVAQNRNVQNERMETPDPQYKVSTGGGTFVPNAPNAPGEEFLVTGYDYMTNNAAVTNYLYNATSKPKIRKKNVESYRNR